MGKYANLEKDVYSIFNAVGWTTLAIPTFPSNYTNPSGDANYIRISIIPSGPGVNSTSVSGIINIDIFVRTGLGPNAISVIADQLDTFLVGTSVKLSSGVTQLFESSLTFTGIDKSNPSLFRAIYTIPFRYNI